jgi:hypothetical protein
MRIHNTGRNKPERLGGLPGVPYCEAPIVRPGTEVVLLVGIEIDAPYSTTRVLTGKYGVVTEMFLAAKIPDSGPADSDLDSVQYLRRFCL